MAEPSDSSGNSLPSDEELLMSVGGGDLGAFEHLVLRHQGSAWNAAVRFLGDTVEAEDIVQEAFIRVFRAASRYEPTASFRTYLFRIVTRLCMDFGDKHRRGITREPIPETLDRSPTPLEIATATDSRREVRAALTQLPPQQRMAIVLRYFEGLGYSQIAEAMETTEKSVERLLARGRTSLHRILLSPFD